MLKNYWRIVSRVERVLDNGILVGAFFLTHRFRALISQSGLDVFFGEGLRQLGPVQDYFVVLGFSLPLFNSVLSMLGAYRSMRLSNPLQLMRLSLSAALVVFVLLGALFYILKLDLSRSFVALYCFVCAFAIFLVRLGALVVLRFFRARGKNFRNLLVVGHGEQGVEIAQLVKSQPELGIRFVGFVTYENKYAPEIVAAVDDFEGALKKNSIDEVLFTEVSENFPIVKQLASIASEEGVGVSLVPDFFSLEVIRSEVSYFGKYPLVNYRSSPSERPSYVLKRILDVVLAGMLIVTLSPLLLFIAIQIKLSSKGPILFKQKRVGLNGRIFTMFKFRSMLHNSERLQEKLERKNEMVGPAFKITQDPRITKFGKFIRKYSLDELPQLINIILGDMSLVGPRPPLPTEVNLYERKQRRRLSMPPGLTCIWQVSGRSDIIDFEEWAQMDLDYIDQWSLGLDMKLLAQTIPVVFRGAGAR
jgi:exopolysaccharide biosynthesis polyprenyl glycosylphosphotransferase